MPTGRAHLCPHHCPKPSGEGGALVLVVVAVVVLALLGAAAHAVAPAIGSAVREVVEVLKIAGLTVAGAGVLALGGWAVHRRQLAAEETASAAARRHDEFPPAVAGLTQAAAEPRELPAASGGPLAIEAPRPWAPETSGLGEPEPDLIQIRRQS